MNVVAVVTAGRSHGPDVLTPIGGVPMLVRAVRLLLAAAPLDRIVLLGVGDRRADVLRACVGLPVDVRGPEHELTSVGTHADQRRVSGSGDGPQDVVLLHSARRPLAPTALVLDVLNAVHAGHDVAVPVLPLVDTVKLVDPTGVLRGTPDRSALRVVQTPQAFRADVLDGRLPDALALAAAGATVHSVPGDPLAFAVRSPWDLELAELLLGADG